MTLTLSLSQTSDLHVSTVPQIVILVVLTTQLKPDLQRADHDKHLQHNHHYPSHSYIRHVTLHKLLKLRAAPRAVVQFVSLGGVGVRAGGGGAIPAAGERKFEVESGVRVVCCCPVFSDFRVAPVSRSFQATAR